MTGDGTKENPYIIMTAEDFNSLRSIQATDVASAAYVELGADINLSRLPNFTPISSRFLNIDGKGHKITNVSVSASGTGSSINTGLFNTLHCTEYIKNLVIEGMVTSRITGGTGNGRAGLLAATLRTAGPNGNVVIFENIECYGSVDVSGQGSSTISVLAGGLAGQLNVESNHKASIHKCFFRGAVQSFVANTSTTAGPNIVFGGIVGRIDLSFSAVASMGLCMTDVDLFVSGTTGVRMGVFGGLCGDCSGPTNTSTPGRMISFISCMGKLTVNFNNTGEFNRPLIFTGMMGRNDTSTGNTGASGMTTEIMNCGCFLTINYDPTVPPLGALDFNGIHGQGARTGSVSASYAVIEYNNPSDTEISETFRIHGLGHTASSANVFFDETVLRKTWSGEVSQENRGITTVQLQSQVFLESQGWVFADA